MACTTGMGPFVGEGNNVTVETTSSERRRETRTPMKASGGPPETSLISIQGASEYDRLVQLALDADLPPRA